MAHDPERLADRSLARPPVVRRSTVLVVAMAESIHVVRWLAMVSQCPDLRFVLCPVFRKVPQLAAEGIDFINPNFEAVRFIRDRQDQDDLRPGETGIFDLESVPEDEIAAARAATGFQPFRPPHLPATWAFAEPGHVATAIRRLRPALVISLEVQFAGYLTLATKDYMESEFPRWLLSNWGSDFYLYRKLEAHQPRLRRIVESIDGYMGECRRDADLVREMGFEGRMLPTMPASGGVDFSTFPAPDHFDPPSARREIQIKGYHGWSGRALHVLAAVHLAARELSKFSIRITLAGPAVREMAETMARRDGLDIACEPYVASHGEAINRLGQARMSVGLGISDGISTTLLEAMAVGTFPLKGTSSCACEWIDNGRTGILVSPHDVRALADGLILAARDDELVDAAAPLNRATVEQRWNVAINRKLILGHLVELASA